jgi:predicted PurR-regulated permease PerM
VAAALLNFIPYLGAITGMALVGAVGLVTYPTLTLAALPPLAYFLVHLTESLVITPLTLGRRLELNPVAILVALAFGGWMWGIVGALISVPLLVVIKVFCDNSPSLATFGDFLSGEAPPAEIAPPASEAAAQTASLGPITQAAGDVLRRAGA